MRKSVKSGIVGAIAFVVILALVSLFTLKEPEAGSRDFAQDLASEMNIEADHTVSAGIFISDIQPLDIDQNGFESTFWLVLAYDKSVEMPVGRITFPFSKNVTMSNASEVIKGERRYSFRKVSGTFKHNWKLSKFPFDTQSLEIMVALPNTGDTSYSIKEMKGNTKIAKELNVNGWEILGVNTSASKIQAPILVQGTADQKVKSVSYSYLTTEVNAKRSSSTLIWKLATGAYAAFMITLCYYFLSAESINTLGARFGILTGAVFATIINMRVASSEMGTAEYLTLVDEIHITVLVYTMVAIMSALITSHLTLSNANGNRIKKIQRRFYVASLTGFIFVNIFIFAKALI